MISFQRAVREFGHRSGYDLVDVKRCGLPVFRLTVEAITLRRQTLPTIQEFILKSLLVGEDTSSGAAALLGLEIKLVEENISRMTMDQMISEVAETIGQPRFQVTELGKERLLHGQNKPHDETLVFDFDALCNSPVKLSGGQIETAKQLRQDQAVLLQPPSLDPPNLQSLPLHTIGQAVRRISGKEFDKQILGLRRILRSQMMFRPAIGLLFRSRASGDVELGLVVDDKLSETHEIEFSRAGGIKKTGFVRGSWANDCSRIRTWIGDYLWSKVADEQAETLLLKLNHFTKDRIDLIEKHERKRRGRSKLRAQDLRSVEDLDREVLSVRQQLDAIPLRFTSTLEVDALLREALENSERELVISIDGFDALGMSRQIVHQISNLVETVKVEIETDDLIHPEPTGAKGEFEPSVQLWSLASLQRRLNLSQRASSMSGLSIIVRDRSSALITTRSLFKSPDGRPTFRIQTAYVTKDPIVITAIVQKLYAEKTGAASIVQ
ncbi:hypothetical protein E0H36_25760 [Rhizobium leguminosarum bv. viciae]|uniref:hypothetical protein n=1 Tax=Rhizobium leguminosarum TaxID=384 RepID=UPI00103F3C42|nr:hypothetical protein [Rhizobium leguminosarum]MBY5487104.1 hypothetical protein [Rhizobium leguminosarum]TBZ28673.1 hypothetical protein E0H36_25760 [Rhizobium leguminosarum bv. viciae]